MKLSARQLAILALIANNIIWGAAPPIFKWSLVDIPPFTLAFLRFFLASLIIFPFICQRSRVKAEDLGKIFILAFFGILVNISFFFLGLQKAPSLNVSIIASASPVFLIIGGIIFLREKPKVKVLLGTLMSLIGVLLIILRPLLEKNSNHAIVGNILYVISTIGLCIYMLLLKKYDLRYPSLVIVFWTFLLSSIMFLPLFSIEMWKYNPLKHLDTRAIIGIGYGAVFSSTLAYFFLDFGLKYIKASEVGVFTYIDPVVTALVALPLLGETITFSYLLGAILVFAGIFIAEGRLHYHPIHLLRKPL